MLRLTYRPSNKWEDEWAAKGYLHEERVTVNSKSKFSPKILGKWLGSSTGELPFVGLGCSSAGTVGNKFAKRKQKENNKEKIKNPKGYQQFSITKERILICLHHGSDS